MRLPGPAFANEQNWFGTIDIAVVRKKSMGQWISRIAVRRFRSAKRLPAALEADYCVADLCV